MKEYFGKPIALIQIPNQRLFGPAAAARYLGISTDTLYKLTDLGTLKAFEQIGRRAYKLEDLEAYVDSLEKWHNRAGEKPAKAREKAS